MTNTAKTTIKRLTAERTRLENEIPGCCSMFRAATIARRLRAIEVEIKRAAWL